MCPAAIALGIKTALVPLHESAVTRAYLPRNLRSPLPYAGNWSCIVLHFARLLRVGRHATR